MKGVSMKIKDKLLALFTQKRSRPKNKVPTETENLTEEKSKGSSREKFTLSNTEHLRSNESIEVFTEEFERAKNIPPRLQKWQFSHNGNKYLIKAGSLEGRKFNNLVPVVECICSEIGQALGLDVVKYWLEEFELDENTNWDRQKVTVCICEWFLKAGDNFIEMGDYLIEFLSQYQTNLYKGITEKCPNYKDNIDKMIVFDYLVNNLDRNWSNFGVLKKADGIEKFAPLFDHNESLGLGLTIRPMTMKIESVSSFKFDKEVNLQDLLSIFDKYSNIAGLQKIANMKALFSKNYENIVKKYKL